MTARPTPSMPSKDAILALVDAHGRLNVRVSPGASADAVMLPASRGPLAVRTTVRAQDGRANDAVLRLLAKALDRPVSSLALTRGAASRDKLIQLVQ